jgi:RimJ/RimL family protein N-acetyltransferase
VLELTPLTLAHTADLARLAGDRDVAGPVGYRLPFTRADAEVLVRDRLRARQQRRAFAFALLAEGSLVGCCGLHSLSAGDRSAEAAFWIGKPYWRRGYGSAGLRELLTFAFAGLQLQVVRARCKEGNAGAAKVLRNNHFQSAGCGERIDRASGPQVGAQSFFLTFDAWWRASEAGRGISG